MNSFRWHFNPLSFDFYGNVSFLWLFMLILLFVHILCLNFRMKTFIGRISWERRISSEFYLGIPRGWSAKGLIWQFSISISGLLLASQNFTFGISTPRYTFIFRKLLKIHFRPILCKMTYYNVFLKMIFIIGMNYFYRFIKDFLSIFMVFEHFVNEFSYIRNWKYKIWRWYKCFQTKNGLFIFVNYSWF